MEDFLACKTFKSNSKKRNSKHKKNKNSSKTRSHQVNFDEGKRIRPRYGSYWLKFFNFLKMLRIYIQPKILLPE